MADIELVIKIPNEMYQKVLDGTYCGTLYEELKHGVLIPKGHGRLIDADAVSLDDIGFFSISDHQKMVHKLTTSCQTIIEADKEDEE